MTEIPNLDPRSHQRTPVDYGGGTYSFNMLEASQDDGRDYEPRRGDERRRPGSEGITRATLLEWSLTLLTIQYLCIDATRFLDIVNEGLAGHQDAHRYHGTISSLEEFVPMSSWMPRQADLLLEGYSKTFQRQVVVTSRWPLR
jgi:hypothetical protein